MFMCDDCHESDCPTGWLEDLGPGSYGRCEGCGKTAGCVDCHGYKHRLPDTELNRRKRELAETLKASRKERESGV